MKFDVDISGLDLKIIKVEGFALSSSYGNNKVFGQTKGLKSIGFVSIILDNNKSGFGETYSGIYVPELIKPIISFFSDKLVGLRLVDLFDKLDKIVEIPFVGFAGIFQSIKASISMAALDVLSKSIELPIYKLFNTELSPIKTYISGGSVAYNSNEIREDAYKLKEIGFDFYKMRMGLQELKYDIDRIKNAIRIFGENKSVIVDMIQGTLKSSYDKNQLEIIFKELNNFNLNWVEEPIEPHEMAKLSFIKSISKNPIATGEAYSGISHFKNLINPDYIDIVQYDLTHSGDFDTCLKISELANSNSIEQVLHVWGSSLALHSNALFALINKKVTFLEIPSITFKLSDDIKTVNYKIDNGFLSFDSDFLGTGVHISKKIKEKYKFVNNTGYSI